ncbi:MAG: hypothetical protein ACRYGK_13330 [Janthinobacterium lividum]
MTRYYKQGHEGDLCFNNTCSDRKKSWLPIQIANHRGDRQIGIAAVMAAGRSEFSPQSQLADPNTPRYCGWQIKVPAAIAADRSDRQPLERQREKLERYPRCRPTMVMPPSLVSAPDSRLGVHILSQMAWKIRAQWRRQAFHQCLGIACRDIQRFFQHGHVDCLAGFGLRCIGSQRVIGRDIHDLSSVSNYLIDVSINGSHAHYFNDFSTRKIFLKSDWFEPAS